MKARFIQNPEGCINDALRAGRDCPVCYFAQVIEGSFVGSQACYDAQCLVYNETLDHIDDGMTELEKSQAREYGDIWSVIECLYAMLGDFAKDFDCYAIAQELIFFKDGCLYANLQREDIWDIIARHDLAGVYGGHDVQA